MAFGHNHTRTDTANFEIPNPDLRIRGKALRCAHLILPLQFPIEPYETERHPPNLQDPVNDEKYQPPLIC